MTVNCSTHTGGYGLGQSEHSPQIVETERQPHAEHDHAEQHADQRLAKRPESSIGDPDEVIRNKPGPERPKHSPERKQAGGALDHVKTLPLGGGRSCCLHPFLRFF
jgi:hypothetical protein